VKIKDIQKLVKDHVKISDKELDDIDRLTNWRKVLFKQEPYEEEWESGITARVNEYGYRSDNFDGDENGFMFLGCSLTEGWGLEEHETWPWIVGKHFDVKVWNLGQGASGDDVCFMNAIRWIPKLKPKVVCMLIPTAGRFKFFDYDGKIHKEFFTWKLPRKPKFPWLFNSKLLYLSTLKNLMGIKLICDEYNIPFIMESSINKLEFPDRARDNEHPGPKWQKGIADYFIIEIKRFF